MLIELKASKRPKRIRECIYSSAYSHLLSFNRSTLLHQNFEDPHWHSYSLIRHAHGFPSCASDHSWREVSTSFQDSTRLGLMKLETRLTVPIASKVASQPDSELADFAPKLSYIPWLDNGPRGRVK